MIKVVHFTGFDPQVIEVDGDDYTVEHRYDGDLVVTKEDREVARFHTWSYALIMTNAEVPA